MMNTMKFANMDEYLDKSSSEVIISKISRGKSFHPAHIDLLKKENDGYLKLSEHFRNYMAFASVYGEVQQELLNIEEANEIRDKKILRKGLTIYTPNEFVPIFIFGLSSFFFGTYLYVFLYTWAQGGVCFL